MPRLITTTTGSERVFGSFGSFGYSVAGFQLICHADGTDATNLMAYSSYISSYGGWNVTNADSLTLTKYGSSADFQYRTTEGRWCVKGVDSSNRTAYYNVPSGYTNLKREVNCNAQGLFGGGVSLCEFGICANVQASGNIDDEALRFRLLDSDTSPYRFLYIYRQHPSDNGGALETLYTANFTNGTAMKIELIVDGTTIQANLDDVQIVDETRTAHTETGIWSHQTSDSSSFLFGGQLRGWSYDKVWAK